MAHIMYVCVYSLSVCQSLCRSVCLPDGLHYVCVYTLCLSVSLYVGLSVCPMACIMCVYILFVCLSVSMSVCQSARWLTLCMCVYILCLSVSLYVGLSVSPNVWLLEETGQHVPHYLALENVLQIFLAPLNHDLEYQLWISFEVRLLIFVCLPACS